MTFEEFKVKFDTEVNNTHLTVDWDGGHCYNGCSHSLNNMDDLDMTPEDRDKSEEYVSMWLSESDQPLYCVPHINDEYGKQVVCDECYGYLETPQERIDHVKEFINLVNQYKQHKWYRVEELEEWVKKQELIQFINTVK